MEPQASVNITPSDLECMLLDEAAEPTALPLSLLTEITNGFSDKLEIGRGGFAVVYKAMLDNCFVAVKRMSIAYKYEKEFNREVECLLKVKHKNIVRFLGYCADTQGNMASYDGKMVMADVQQRLLCFEYLSNGSLERYITDSSEGLEWRCRYQIIKGICEGLNHLHQKNIAHLDLKPGNILLDEEMMPKITDFGLSRCFEEAQTHVSTKNVGGTLGYLAPEFTNRAITLKFDLYSLGVIVLEILTGKRGYQTVENVLESWSNTTVDTLQLEQIRLCAKIGIECTEPDPAKRPACMMHIIERLAKTESTQVNPVDGPSKLLVLQQSALCFPFRPNKIIVCPLQLTNSTDKHVVFRLKDKSADSYLRLPLYGLVPPNTPYTLMVTSLEKEEQPRKHFIDLILHIATSITRDEHINTFNTQPDKFFEEMGKAVQEVKLKALYTRPRYITTSSSKSISPTVKIICKVNDLPDQCYSLDTNQAKQWVMIGQKNGYVDFWDYSQRKVGSLKLPATKVRCVRFVERKQWIVAGTEDSYLHVYDHENMQKITSLRFDTDSLCSVDSVAVHPTQPYLLSAGITYMKLWDWDKGWDCVRTFELQNILGICPVAFNTNDTFASASVDYTVEVWSLDSPKSKYSFLGHLKNVNCLDFFTCHDQEFLVTGSDDHTAKIWYLQKKICAYTLEAFVSPVTSVLYQPNLQTLIVGSEDGAIYLWSTINCRTYSSPPALTKIINIGCVGAIYHLAYALGSIMVGKGNTIAIMDINNVNYQQQSTDYNKQHLSADTRQHVGDTTSKEIAGSMSKLPIIDVHPPELRFPYHPNQPISCSLDLTNNTDENVAFRLVDKSGKSPWCFTKLPLYGIVPRRSTCTLIVTTKEEMKLKEKEDFDLVIQSSLLGDKYIMVFQNQFESGQFFDDAKESGNMVHEVILKVIYLQYEDITSEDRNISVKYNPDDLWSIDAHPTEPWILTGHISGNVGVWNHEMKNPMISFKVSKDAVRIAKFIAIKEWIVAVTGDDYVHVYHCARGTNITKIESVKLLEPSTSPILVVHSILPFLLSTSSRTMPFDWELGWKHTQNFCTNIWSDGGLRTVAFNPGDNSRFAGGFEDGVVKVWRLESEGPDYSLLGHYGIVNCVDFIRHGDQHYLVSGSDDCTAKIWDLQKGECTCTLRAMSPVLCILAHPNLPVLITGTEHGIIHLWSSTDFSLKRAINLGGGGPVVGLGCLKDSPRILIGQENAISTMEIHDDEALRPNSAAEMEHCQTEAEHGETEEPAATREQQALPSKSVTPPVQRLREKRRVRALAKRIQAEAEHGETQDPAARQQQQVLDYWTNESARPPHGVESSQRWWAHFFGSSSTPVERAGGLALVALLLALIFIGAK